MMLRMSAAALLILCGCGEKIDALNPSDCPAGVVPNYEQDIRPVVETLCTGCHSSTLAGAGRNGAPAGVNFDSYAAVSAAALKANTRLGNESMPPGSSSKASAAQKRTFACWIKGGLQERP